MRKLLLLLALAACGDEETKLASTQITLTVQADDALRSQLDALRATLFVNDGGSWSQRSSAEVSASNVKSWPVDIPILPREGEESAQIEVIVEAFAGGQRLAQARALSSFRPDVLGSASASLFVCASGVCAADDCHGASCAVCTESGTCSTDDAQDAGTPLGDAAQSTSDAAMPDAAAPVVCPANACAAPYVCVTTPAGYTCRGQFADWPMPDKVPGAKVAPSYTATPDFVTDNVTKLIWQLGLPRIYPGCTEYVMYGDGSKGDTGELCTRAQGRAYCDNLVQGGFDDWRLPTVIELISLYDLSDEDARYSIDRSAFADIDYSAYVSDSTYAGGPGQVWGVNYISAQTYYAANYSGKIRCVRAGAVPSFATPADRYAIAGDQVTDKATGLIWQRASATTQYAREEGDAGLPLVPTACSAPWRVPTVKELYTLIDFTRADPAIEASAFPSTSTDSYWGLPTYFGNAVDFETGELYTGEDVGFARCVQ